MSRDMLSDVVTSALAKAMDGSAARHRVLADNIANVETPGFQRKDVAFHDQLRAALNSADNREKAMASLERVRPFTFLDPARSSRADGNTVDIEVEMGELAKNTLEYESSVQLLVSKLRGLRTVITEGRR